MYVAVDDLTAALGEAETLGAVRVVPPTAVPGVGTFAMFRDPAGSMVGMMEQTTQGPPDIAVPSASFRTHGAATDPEVAVPSGGVTLAGSLTVPDDPIGVVLFAHGSGSSRHSPRNQYVASVLNNAGVATLLLDLLTRDEEDDRQHVFDIDLLAGRLADATSWVRGHEGTQDLQVGYFGASTGAAALTAAAAPGSAIAAVVSRGGRPDLAGARLQQVVAPTLLIVGGADPEVLELNRAAKSSLRCQTDLEIVPGATHLFEEPGALETVARLACDWFVSHLTAS